MLKEKPASRRISARRTEAEARMSFMGVTGDWRKGLQLSVVSLQLKEKKKQYWGVAGIQTQCTRRHRTLAAYDFLRRFGLRQLAIHSRKNTTGGSGDPMRVGRSNRLQPRGLGGWRKSGSKLPHFKSDDDGLLGFAQDA